MTREEFLARQLGDDPPLLADGRRPPDRREISFRWLSGTFMTAITSSLLMGVALFGAVEGREQLTLPAEALASSEMQHADANTVEKGSRLLQSIVTAKKSDREIMEVSTMVRDGDRDVVRKQPFAHVKMALATPRAASRQYPRFDPLKIFATGNTDVAATPRTGQIYGADVDSEISLRTTDFPVEAPGRPYASAMTLDEVEETVRTNGSVLTDGTIQLASLYYVDPRRFGTSAFDLDFSASLNARVVKENVSIASLDPNARNETPEFVDDIVPVRKSTSLDEALGDAGYGEEQYAAVRDALARYLDPSALPDETVVRVGSQQVGERAAEIVRLSIYDKDRHIVTVARSDRGGFVAGAEPPETPAVASAFDDTLTTVAGNRDLPNVYDGIYRAGLSYGMSLDMVGRVVRMLASNVDFQAKLHPTDSLEVFFSVANEEGNADEESELLFVNAKFGSNVVRLYRFQHPEDNSIDYYDPEGKSAELFLLRNPVPNGQFRSGFGMRRHPILGYRKMHTGVDWSAPRGTPIIAAGNGTVEKAGWDSGGYGNQTLVRHANGYVSSYNHQSGIAKGVKPGAKVRQGQVIGFVGSTGLATGPHLHYELVVNGNKVDPMRVRLPDGKTLKEDALVAFKRERDRIDRLLDIDTDAAEVASR